MAVVAPSDDAALIAPLAAGKTLPTDGMALLAEGIVLAVVMLSVDAVTRDRFAGRGNGVAGRGGRLGGGGAERRRDDGDCFAGRRNGAAGRGDGPGDRHRGGTDADGTVDTPGVEGGPAADDPWEETGGTIVAAASPTAAVAALAVSACLATAWPIPPRTPSAGLAARAGVAQPAAKTRPTKGNATPRAMTERAPLTVLLVHAALNGCPPLTRINALPVPITRYAANYTSLDD